MSRPGSLPAALLAALGVAVPSSGCLKARSLVLVDVIAEPSFPVTHKVSIDVLDHGVHEEFPGDVPRDGVDSPLHAGLYLDSDVEGAVRVVATASDESGATCGSGALDVGVTPGERATGRITIERSGSGCGATSGDGGADGPRDGPDISCTRVFEDGFEMGLSPPWDEVVGMATASTAEPLLGAHSLVAPIGLAPSGISKMTAGMAAVRVSFSVGLAGITPMLGGGSASPAPVGFALAGLPGTGDLFTLSFARGMNGVVTGRLYGAGSPMVPTSSMLPPGVLSARIRVEWAAATGDSSGGVRVFINDTLAGMVGGLTERLARVRSVRFGAFGGAMWTGSLKFDAVVIENCL